MRSRDPVVTRLLIALSCYFFLNGIMQSLVSLRGVTAGLSGVELGLTLGLASGALGIFIDMPVAAGADRRGKYLVVQAGMACALAASLTLLAGGRAPLVIGAFLAGVGASAGGNSLLSWLGSARPPTGQARLQGLNGSVQRVGALLAAGLVGLAIAVRLPIVMAAGAAVVSAAGLLATRSRALRAADTAAGGPPGVAASYRRGFAMLSNRGLLLAASINMAVNVVFLETNSYVPLAHGPDRAVIVTGTLVARDLAAVAAGAGIAILGLNVAFPALVAGALAVAAACAWAGGLATGSLALIALGGVQGAVIGVCIAAANLFTIGAIPAHQRTWPWLRRSSRPASCSSSCPLAARSSCAQLACPTSSACWPSSSRPWPPPPSSSAAVPRGPLPLPALLPQPPPPRRPQSSRLPSRSGRPPPGFHDCDRGRPRRRRGMRSRLWPVPGQASRARMGSGPAAGLSAGRRRCRGRARPG
jgi:MFS family permease